MPDEVVLPDAPDDKSRMDVRSRDTWKPRHSLEGAVEKLSPEIREALQTRLNGEFREIRRYRPSRMLELESGVSREAPASEEVLVPDEDSDGSDD